MNMGTRTRYWGEGIKKHSYQESKQTNIKKNMAITVIPSTFTLQECFPIRKGFKQACNPFSSS